MLQERRNCLPFSLFFPQALITILSTQVVPNNYAIEWLNEWESELIAFLISGFSKVAQETYLLVALWVKNGEFLRSLDFSVQTWLLLLLIPNSGSFGLLLGMSVRTLLLCN